MKGNRGTGPSKTLDERGAAEGGQRWRFVPLRQRLSLTSARPAALPAVDYSLNLEGVAAEDTNFSHFSFALEQQSDENCTAAFVAYLTSVKPLSLSLPLVYRNRAKIVEFSLKAIQASVVYSGADAVQSVSTCLSALSVDLGPSGFFPYFPRVVANFADVFSAGHNNNTASKSTQENTRTTSTDDPKTPHSQNGTNGEGHSLFWQPEDILVPLFASLSEFTKLLISHLLRAPDKTIADLGPLLAHRHYRVREMTAESCLGYLIRKARDSSIRDPFVKTVIRAPYNSDLTSHFPLSSITDGLGVTLFEGVRLPSGRLHSRGKNVLRVALSTLSEVGNFECNVNTSISAAEGATYGGDDSIHGDAGLLILSRCFASICRHITNSDDMHSVASFLLEDANLAFTAKNWKHLANLLFMIRKWIYNGGRNLNTVLGPALCQRVINVAIRAVEVHCSDERLVCEAICTLVALHRHSSETFREKSVLRALVTAFDLISKVNDIPVLSAALNVILDYHIYLDASHRRALASSVAAVCDRISLVGNHAPVWPAESDIALKHKVISLAFALRFLRTVGSIYSSRSTQVKFSAPGIDSFILSILGRISDTPEANSDNLPSGVEPATLLHGALEYMSYVKVEKSFCSLRRFFSSNNPESCTVSAFLLAACARQGNSSIGENSSMIEIVTTLVRKPRQTQEELWKSKLYCAGISRCIDAFGFEAIFGNSTEEGNSSRSTVLSMANKVLVENLSSESSGLRKSSLLLLAKLGPRDAGSETGFIGDQLTENGIPLQESLQMLRSMFPSGLSVRSLSIPLLAILHVNRALEGMSSCVVLLQEVIRLLGQVQDVQTEIVFFLSHFALGVIQTPLKVLWKHAGDLLSALATRNRDIVMSCTVAHLKRCGEALRNQERNPAVVGSLSSNETHGGLKNGNGVREGNEALGKNYDAMSVSDEDENDEVGNRIRITNTPAKRQQDIRKIVSKRQRAIKRDFASLHWDPSEWLSFRDTANLSLQDGLVNRQLSNFVEGSTDLITVITELCRILSKDPKVTLKYRADFISLYLCLPPAMFSRRRGNLLVSNILTLLEKMGGLKCCESDKDMELVMRERILSDLTRPAPVLQEPALKCLCVSRSGFVKQHLDSLLKLINDKTFREELTLLTDNLFADWNVPINHGFSSEQMEFLDVIVRICFSKMVAGRNSPYSRRSALFSFLASKLGSPVFVSRITSLLLQPLRDHTCQLDLPDSDSISKTETFPSRPVQMGMLNSIDSFVKFCHRIIPLDCWRELCVAIRLIFSRAESGSGGQPIRAASLRLFSSLMNYRPDDTSFIVTEVLQIAKVFIGTSGGRGASGTPALLEFVASFTTSLPSDSIDDLFDRCIWLIQYCVEVMVSPLIDCKAIDFSCDVMQCYAAYIERKVESKQSDLQEHGLVMNVPDAMLQLVTRLTSIMTGKFSEQKKWSEVFEKLLKTAEYMIERWPGSYKILSQMVEPLVSYLLNQSSGRISSPVLSTLCSIATSKPAHGQFDSVFELDTSRVLHLLSLRRFSQDDESYISLCTFIGIIGGDDMGVVTNILRDLRAMSHKRLEEPDLDKRIEALNRTSKMFLAALGGSDRGLGSDACDVVTEKVEPTGEPRCSVSLSSNAILALCHGCMASVWTTDTAVRGTAGYCLKLIARWVAISNSVAAKECQNTLFNLLLQQLLACKDTTQRREFSSALGEFVRSSTMLTEDERSQNLHKYLKGLCNTNDVELDFFENLVHLQAHRRSRALRQLEQYLRKVDPSAANTDEHCSRRFVADVFALPLAMKIVLEKPNVESRKHRNTKQIHSEDAQKDVIAWAVKLVGTTASCLSWYRYKACLDGLLRKLSTQDDADEVLVIYKLVVAVAEAFPEKGEERFPDGNTATDYLVDTLLPNMLLHVSSGAVTEDLLHARERPASRFVEVGNRNEKSQSMFRAPVAIAIGVLMARLPEEKLESMISLLVTPLTSALRSRMVSTRESAKLALTSVVLSLGPKYLNFILRQVLSALNEGFRKDSCIYIVHGLLQGIRKHRNRKENDGREQEFDVSGCLDIVIDLILFELKNGASETRKDFEDPNASDTRLKQANARASKAGECAELISELVPFNLCAPKLCTSITDSLAQTFSGKLASRLNDCLRRLLHGFSRNASMSARDAFKLCFFLIAEESVTKNHSHEGGSGNFADGPSLKPFSSTTFGLQLLNFVLGRYVNDIIGASEESTLLRSMAQPFLPLSICAMKSGKDELTLAAFRVLQRLLRLPLAHRDVAAEEMAKTIANVLSEHSGGVGEDYSVTGELFNTCLRAAAVIFKEIDSSKLLLTSKDRVDTILAISCNCIQSGSLECRAAAVASLRSIVSAKIMLPSVYDSIERVNQLAIHSQSLSLTRACISVSVLFFISYPLGETRFRQHLDFFVRNLSYELSSGRVAALETLREIILKVPSPVLEAECEYLFLSLTANTARDSDSTCRELALECVRLIFQQIPTGGKIVDLLKACVALIGVECSMTNLNVPPVLRGKVDLTVVNCGASSLAAACRSKRLTILQLKLVLWSVIVAMENLSDDDEWKTWFILFRCIEAVFEQQTDGMPESQRLETGIVLCKLWKKMGKFLLHPNQQLRLIASRLVGRHLSACGGRNARPMQAMESEFWFIWNCNETVREWMKACCVQLEADQLAIELGQQCLKSVMCMADVIRKHPTAGDVGGQKGLWEDADEIENGIVKRGELLTKSTGESTTNESKMLRWILSRFCGLATRGGRESQDFLRRACALRFLLVTAKWWGNEVVVEFKKHYILPVVLVLESGELHKYEMKKKDATEHRRRRTSQRMRQESIRHGENEDEIGWKGLKAIAEGLQATLTEIIGSMEYYEIYHALQAKRTASKLERKRKAAVLAAVDPERNAKRKRAKLAIKRLRKRGMSAASARKKLALTTTVSKLTNHADDAVETLTQDQIEKRQLTEDM